MGWRIYKCSKKTIKANDQVNSKQIEVFLYNIKQRVNQLYFGILAINAQLKLLDYLREDFKANKKVMVSVFNNQVITQSEIDLIDMQLLNIDQNKIELISNKDAYLKMLSLFLNQELDNSTVLEVPKQDNIINENIYRPEIAFYKTQRSMYEAQKKIIKAKNMPQFGLFLQGRYGNPALNMLENKFKLYGIGGIKLTWNFANLYTKDNELNNIEINKIGIDIEEETFLFNTNYQMKQGYENIKKTKKLLVKDDEIISLREKKSIGKQIQKWSLYC